MGDICDMRYLVDFLTCLSTASVVWIFASNAFENSAYCCESLLQLKRDATRF